MSGKAAGISCEVFSHRTTLSTPARATSMPLGVGLAAKRGLDARCSVKGRIIDDLLLPLKDIHSQCGDRWQFRRLRTAALRAAVT